MRLCDLAAYLNDQCDEEPLYLFDGDFGVNAPDLLKDYKIPRVFSDDLLASLGMEPHCFKIKFC